MIDATMSSFPLDKAQLDPKNDAVAADRDSGIHGHWQVTSKTVVCTSKNDHATNQTM